MCGCFLKLLKLSCFLVLGLVEFFEVFNFVFVMLLVDRSDLRFFPMVEE